MASALHWKGNGIAMERQRLFNGKATALQWKGNEIAAQRQTAYKTMTYNTE